MRSKDNVCNVRECVSHFVKRVLGMQPRQWIHLDISERQREYNAFQQKRIAQMCPIEKAKILNRLDK